MVDATTLRNEFDKIQVTMDSLLPNTDFMVVMLCRCERNVDDKDIPENCIVASMSELEHFYGHYYFDRLKYSL